MAVKQQWCDATIFHNPLLIAQYRFAICIDTTKLITLGVMLFWMHCSPAFAVDQWEKNAFFCTAADGYRFPSKGKVQDSTGEYPNDCDDGDMTLFNGLLCASGDTRGCDAVKKAMSQPDVNSSHAKFWRSPRRAQNNNLHMEGAQTFTSESGGDKSFSPDMELGGVLWKNPQKCSF